MMTGPLGNGGSPGPRGSSCVSLPVPWHPCPSASQPPGQCHSLSATARLAHSWPVLGKLTPRGE